MIKINDDIAIHFPLQLIPRDEQIQGLQFIKKSINEGNKFILMNLPTGTGKSFIVNMLANWYRNSVNEQASFDILTNSKILQDQYIRENLFIKNFKGKSNYFCDKYDTDCEKGIEICKALKSRCDHCPYDAARKAWLESDVGLTNFHLFNTLALYVRDLLTSRKSTVLIIDEAHDFEAVFTDYISTNTSTRSLKKFGFEARQINEYDERIKKIKGIGQYVSMIQNQFLPDVEKIISKFESKLSNSKAKKVLEEFSKYLTHCQTQINKYTNLVTDYEKNPENWVLDFSKTEKDGIHSGIVLEAKPVWVSEYLEEYVWSKYDHILMMSSTINKDIMGYTNGLDVKRTTYFEIDSPFHINRRPIFYIKNIGKMTYDKKEETFKKQIPIIKKILKRNEKNSGVIHCSTFEFSKLLQEQLIDKRLIFHNSENREEMLEKFINNKSNAVFVSPSILTGVDFKGDLSRFQIIMKIQYPYLGSNKIKQRQKTNRDWYSWKTCADLIQMYGRSIRSVDDWCETYILDSSFSDLLRYSNRYLPRWFTAAVRVLN